MPREDVFKSTPKNPAEQNPKLNQPETSGPQNLVDEMSVGMKPPRSDSSSETFVAEKSEAMRHEQVQRIQEGTKMSSDAPNDLDDLLDDGNKSRKDVVIGGRGDPNLRSSVNPGGLTDLTPEGIARSTETSQVRSLGMEGREGDSGRFEMYLGGRKVVVKEETKAEYERLMQELKEIQDGRLANDIGLGDPFWAKKSELDQFIARF